MNAVTTFHLVRHALHAGPAGILLGRQAGVHLSRARHDQARELATFFSDRDISLVMASPRERARETAQPIAGRLSLTLQVSHALDEFDPGAWQGQPFDELAQDAQWIRWNSERSKARAPDGESMAHMAARMRGVIRSLHIHYRGEEIVLVSHAEPIRALLLQAQALSADLWSSIDISPASVSTLRFDGVTGQVQQVNGLPCCGAPA